MWIATATAAVAASSPLSLGSSYCHYCTAEGIGCSTSYRISSSWIQSLPVIQRISDHSGLRFRCENPRFGVTQFQWWSKGHKNCDLRVSVAADYSDSLPESSSFVGDNGYHPLEEIREFRRDRVTKLTDAEIARTAVEANNKALLLFRGTVHCEPHQQASWAEFQYVIDEYGDIFFKIYNEENILQDREANNPVNALIGMDIPQYEKRMVDISDYDIFDSEYGDDITSYDDYLEFEKYEELGEQVDWGKPDSSSWVHPVYFAKCLTKAVKAEHVKRMDYPSNGVSVQGYLKPACADEELNLLGFFNDEENDGYTLGWTDEVLDTDPIQVSVSYHAQHIAGEEKSPNGEMSDSSDNGSCKRSTIYRLEITKIELFSVYGFQLAISLEDFLDAEPDILVHSTPALVERFEQGKRSNVALKALCKKKGLLVEGANLIGVDSLGMDVRVFSGSEVLTHRFPFKVRATSKGAAEKQIQQLLFPRSHRKKFRIHEILGI